MPPRRTPRALQLVPKTPATTFAQPPTRRAIAKEAIRALARAAAREFLAEEEARQKKVS